MSKRTIDLAGEILAISQIVRLRDLDLEIRKGFTPGRMILIVLGLLMSVFGASVFGSSQRGLVALLGILLVLAVVVYSVFPTKRYVLAIELASGSISGLSAKNSAALTHLKDVIQQVIENPPMQPTTFQVGDVYSVDARGGRGMQFGSGNWQSNA